MHYLTYDLKNITFRPFLCPPHWEVVILFLLFPVSGVRRPSSRLVSGHFKENHLFYLYQIWYGCLLG